MGSYVEFSILGKVPHPREGVVPALLLDLEIPHIDSRQGVVGDLELHIYWPLFEIGIIL